MEAIPGQQEKWAATRLCGSPMSAPSMDRKHGLQCIKSVLSPVIMLAVLAKVAASTIPLMVVLTGSSPTRVSYLTATQFLVLYILKIRTMGWLWGILMADTLRYISPITRVKNGKGWPVKIYLNHLTPKQAG